MPPGIQSFWVPWEVWLQASCRVEDRETAAAPCICGECVVPCYYRANTVPPIYMLVIIIIIIIIIIKIIVRLLHGEHRCINIT